MVKLHHQGVDPESPQWRSAYRSFEGEVFENFVYERLIRYVRDHNEVKKFIAKIPGTKHQGNRHTDLMLNKKGQIVYKVRYKDLGEFDSLIFTDKELYFVEMTLVASVSNLRSRLPKKRALLQLLFPDYDVRPLLVVSKEATGLSRLPDFCTVWQSKGVDTKEIFRWIADGKKERKSRFLKTTHQKIITPNDLEVRTFKYYDTLIWLLHNLPGKNGNPLNLQLFRSQKFRRFHDLYTKVYLGTMESKEFMKLYPEVEKLSEPFVYVAIEREPLGEAFLTYFHFQNRNNLLNIRIKEGQATSAKKDPMGITVTELTHLTRAAKSKSRISSHQLKTLESILEEENKRGK